MSNQRDLFSELSVIQDVVVNNMLSNEKKYDNTQDYLLDTTYETIYRFLELIDGYGINRIRYEIKNVNSGEIINHNTDLHDNCEDFLSHTGL